MIPFIVTKKLPVIDECLMQNKLCSTTPNYKSFVILKLAVPWKRVTCCVRHLTLYVQIEQT